MVEWGQFSLSDSEKVLHSIGLSLRMSVSLRFFSLRHLVQMYMTVSLMVIDTQDMRAVRKHAFPALSRSF
jgi:hypothetical protein